MSGKITSITLFNNRAFSNGESFDSHIIDLTSAKGYFSCHCLVSGSINLTAEVSLDKSHWIPLSGFNKNLSDTEFVEAMDIPVSCFLRFNITASSNGAVTLMFAYI